MPAVSVMDSRSASWGPTISRTYRNPESFPPVSPSVGGRSRFAPDGGPRRSAQPTGGAAGRRGAEQGAGEGGGAGAAAGGAEGEARGAPAADGGAADATHAPQGPQQEEDDEGTLGHTYPALDKSFFYIFFRPLAEFEYQPGVWYLYKMV